MSSARKTTKTATPVTYNYSKSFAPTDESIPYRLVGSFEYVRALEAFHQLLSMSSTDELAIYDEVLKERIEFSFVNGVNLAFAAPPDLLQSREGDRARFSNEFLKKGLAWMMALARIELSATSSLYGNSRYPFESLDVTPYDAAPFVDILRDDVLAHLRSLAQEPGFREVTRRSRKPDTWTLAYLRRIKLIRDMLATLERVGGPTVSADIQPLNKELDKYRRDLVESVQIATGNFSTIDIYRSSDTRDVTFSKTVVGICEDLSPGATANSSASSNSSSTGDQRRVASSGG